MTAAGAALPLHRKLLFGAALAAFVLVVIEVMLQGFYFATAGTFLFRRTLPPIYAADETRCYKVAPDLDYEHRTNEFSSQIYTNSQGLRTGANRREFPVERPEDTYRVLALGPSFAFGWGADHDQIYTTLIERRLRTPNGRIELINLGTPSQGPEHQLCWLAGGGRAYDPDLVILTVYGASVPPLPRECPEQLSCPVVKDGLLYTTPPTPTRRFVASVKNFASVFYGYYVYNLFVSLNAPEAGKELHAGTAEEISEGDRDALAESYAAYAAYVRSLIDDQTLVAFLHLPNSFVVHPEDAPRWRHLGVPAPEVARQRIADETRALRERGIAIIDTTSKLIERAETERLYFWLDIHLTPAGNEAVAAAAVPQLQSMIDAGATRPPGPQPAPSSR